MSVAVAAAGVRQDELVTLRPWKRRLPGKQHKGVHVELGFVSSRRRGIHYDLAKFTINHLKTANLALKAQTERHFEHAIVSHLQA